MEMAEEKEEEIEGIYAYEMAKKNKKVPSRCILVAYEQEGRFDECRWTRWELYYDPENHEFLLYRAWNGLGNPCIAGEIRYRGPFNEKWVASSWDDYDSKLFAKYERKRNEKKNRIKERVFKQKNKIQEKIKDEEVIETKMKFDITYHYFYVFCPLCGEENYWLKRTKYSFRREYNTCSHYLFDELDAYDFIEDATEEDMEFVGRMLMKNELTIKVFFKKK